MKPSFLFDAEYPQILNDCTIKNINIGCQGFLKIINEETKKGLVSIAHLSRSHFTLTTKQQSN